MDVTIRRLENNLITLGTGVIAFGFWSFIKYVLTALATGSKMWEDVDADFKASTVIISWVLILLYALVYLWLGLSARAEGNGRRKRIFYLIVIGVIAFFSTVIIILELLAVIYLNVSIARIAITLIIDATRMFFLTDILYSSVKLRILRKRNRAESEKEAEAA